MKLMVSALAFVLLLGSVAAGTAAASETRCLLLNAGGVFSDHG
jgi:hypothetical protein